MNRLHPVFAAELIGAAPASPPDAAFAWRPGDLLIWGKRWTLHRATPCDDLNHQRDLRRTTISDPRLVRVQPERKEAAVAS